MSCPMSVEATGDSEPSNRSEKQTNATQDSCYLGHKATAGTAGGGGVKEGFAVPHIPAFWATSSMCGVRFRVRQSEAVLLVTPHAASARALCIIPAMLRTDLAEETPPHFGAARW
jgi:hypothetical protein